MGLKDSSVVVPLIRCVADMLADPSKKQVVSVGKKSCPEMERMFVSVHASYDPNKTVIHIDPSDEEEMKFWEEKNPNISTMAKRNYVAEYVMALVYKDFACKAPVTDPNSLAALLLSVKA